MPLIATIVAIGATAASVGEGIYAMKNKPTPPQPPSQTKPAEVAQAAALAQAQALQKRRGMASTALTSPMGVSSGPAQAQTATLGT